MKKTLFILFFLTLILAKDNREELIKELKWGVNIAWNKYRNALLDDDTIYDIISDIPTYNYKRK